MDQLYNNVPLEKDLIGFLINNGSEFYTIAEILSPDDFTAEILPEIYMAMEALFRKGKVIDQYTIYEAIKELPGKEDISLKVSFEFIGYYADFTTMTKDKLEDYAKTLKDLSKKRKLKRGMEEIINRLPSEPADDLCELASTKAMEISILSDDRTFNTDRALQESIDRRKRIEESGVDGIIGIRTGFVDLDRITGGLEPGEFTVIAARPSVGKTSMAVSLALNMLENDKTVVFFELEMTTSELMDKLLSLKSGIPLVKFSNGYKFNIDPMNNEKDKFDAAVEWFRTKKFAIIDEVGLTSNKMRSKLKKQQSILGKIDAVIVDYLQLMEEPSLMKFGNVATTTFISQQLKKTAKHFKTPLIALCQLNRAVEGRCPQEPRLSDLRESGSIEQDADMVLGLYRESMDKTVPKDSRKFNDNVVKILCLKHRGGIKEDIFAVFDGCSAAIIDPKNTPKKVVVNKPIFNFD